MLPVSRLGDDHICPAVTGNVPHVGGKIVGPGVVTVLVGNKPVAVGGDSCGCPGHPNAIVAEPSSVLVGDKPVARQGNKTTHLGTIVSGCSTVLIG